MPKEYKTLFLYNITALFFVSIVMWLNYNLQIVLGHTILNHVQVSGPEWLFSLLSWYYRTIFSATF